MNSVCCIRYDAWFYYKNYVSQCHEEEPLNNETKKAIPAAVRPTLCTSVQYVGKPFASKNLLQKF